MLSGVGGRTIEEAKTNMSFSEAMAWVKYRERYGSFNVGYRLELASAIVARQVHVAAGGKQELGTFMPHEPPPVVTLEQAMESWV